MNRAAQIAIAVLWFPILWTGIMFFTWTEWHHTEYAHVAVEEKVENAVRVQEFQNAFTQWRHIGLFGGGGAGGIGSDVLWAESPESFLHELNPNEKIYTVVQVRQDVSYPTVEKVYIAGVENRNMLMGYRDQYRAPSRYSRIESISNEEIVFSTAKDGGPILLTIVGSATLGLVWIIGMFSLETRE